MHKLRSCEFGKVHFDWTAHLLHDLIVVVFFLEKTANSIVVFFADAFDVLLGQLKPPLCDYFLPIWIAFRIQNPFELSPNHTDIKLRSNLVQLVLQSWYAFLQTCVLGFNHFELFVETLSFFYTWSHLFWLHNYFDIVKDFGNVLVNLIDFWVLLHYDALVDFICFDFFPLLHVYFLFLNILSL